MSYGKIPEDKAPKNTRWGVDVNGLHIHCSSIKREGNDLFLYDSQKHIIARVKEKDVWQVTLCKLNYVNVLTDVYFRDF